MAAQRSLLRVIAVVGVGAVGGVVAARLASRADLVCCVRTPFRELVVETAAARLASAPRVETQPARVGPVAWLLLATKANQIEGAAPWLDALVGSDTRVAVLQNGVEHRERLAHHVSPARIVPVVVQCPCNLVAPGHVVQHAPARLTVPADADGLAFAALLAGSDVEVVASEDFALEAWRKLCWNVVSGALTALAARPLGEIDGATRARVGRALARECAAVARADGVALDDGEALAIADAIARSPSRRGPSILADRLAGRPLEWDARNGAIVRIGARHGVDAPWSRRVCVLLREIRGDRDTDLLPRLSPTL